MGGSEQLTAYINQKNERRWLGRKKNYFFINLIMLEYVMDRANINELISFNYELLMKLKRKETKWSQSRIAGKEEEFGSGGRKAMV